MTGITVMPASAQPAQAAAKGPAPKSADAPARQVPAAALNRTQTKLANTVEDGPQVPKDLQRQLDDLARRESGGLLTARMQIAYDEASGRVYGQVVDQATKEILRQVPSDKLLRLFATGREQLAMILDRKV